MNSDPSLRAIFNEALDRTDAVERAAYLDKACGADAALRERIEKLLRAHDEAEGFLSNPNSGRQSDAGITALFPDALPVTEKAGDRIGRYRLYQQIGEGGCGVVYMAEQEEPVRRRVALKVIKLGMDTKQVIARFEAERQALALMDHPNIARVLDAGATESGRPFFVMELVRGIKITEYCDQNNLSTEERLKLFAQVCQAIQHAHQKGIVHRDLKPSNILVTTIDGVAVPKVIDFGIAKATNNQVLTDKTVFTAFDQFIGTPAYMSPEQAEMSGVDVDTRTDIYSLGVVLYELLTGRTPFDAQQLLRCGLDEIRRTIRETEPPKPSTRLTQELVAAGVKRFKPSAGGAAVSDEEIRASSRRLLQIKELVPVLQGDLDWIVMKCLEKDRNRRYETANGLATDLQRHLQSEPIVARPPTGAYRLQKLIRRNKLACSAAMAVLLVLLGGIIASTWQAVRATRAEQEQSRLREAAEINERKAASEALKSRQVARFLETMLAGVVPSRALGRDTTMLREIVDKAAERVDPDLVNQPEVEAELRSTLGNTYDRLGEFAKAERMHRQALTLRQSMFGETDARVAASLSGLALALVQRGGTERAMEAEGYARRALTIRQQLLGSEHPDLAQSLHGLASCLQGQRRYAEAETLYRESLALRRQSFGNDHDEVANSLTALAITLKYARRPAESEFHAREALTIRKKLFAGDHPEVARSLYLVALALRDQGQLAQAEPPFRESFVMRSNLLPVEHPELTGHLTSLVNLLRALGKVAQAEALCREELARRQKQVGHEHPAVAAVLHLLSDLLALQGKPAEAENASREAFDIRKAHLEPDHPDIGLSLQRLSGLLQQQGKASEAEALLRAEWEQRRNELGANHPVVSRRLQPLITLLCAANRWTEAHPLLGELLANTGAPPGDQRDLANFLRQLARTRERQGELAEAEAVYRLELATERKLSGPEHAFTANALHSLALVLKQQNKFMEAEAVIREALAIRRKGLGGAGLKLTHSLAGLADVLVLQNRFAEAEPLAREWVAMRESASPDEWETFGARGILGGILLRQAKYAEAEALLLSGYAGLKQRAANLPGTGQQRLEKTLQRLVQLYELTESPEQAAQWKQELAEFQKIQAEAKP
jgi:eukaryotic-like serine/threonine-protein kinase